MRFVKLIILLDNIFACYFKLISRINSKGVCLVKKMILLSLLSFMSCTISIANECKIQEVPSNGESNNYTFKTILQKDLFVYTPQPKEALLLSDGITYIYDKDNLIGFLTSREKFQKSETIEKTIQESYFYSCSKPIIKINKVNFDVFIIENDLDNNKSRTTAFIIDKTDDSYFYLLSFAGFSHDEVIKMLIRK